MAHLITNEWELKSFLLDFIKLNNPHLSANIKEAFLKSLNNTSNNITFLQIVEDELSKKFIHFESKDKHMCCLVHIMNLAAQQTLIMLKVIEDNELSNENSGPINTLSNSDQNFRALSINEEEWVCLSEIEELLKKAAINAINKLKEYYNKTDTILYAVLLILDSRLKLEYMKNNKWKKC
ncbi:hypothetical protein C1646_669221 [Rhizophagus diaphanus]|nr:hypothetical protein C1646_669221 [Rhizophagus diaphanus] [Rhizophagus sp. MUCL 43196]